MKWKFRVFWMALAAVLFFVPRLLGDDPARVEWLDQHWWGNDVSRILSALSGKAPFSVAELLVGLFALRQLWGVVSGLRQRMRQALTTKALIAHGALRLGYDLAWVSLVFTLLWGFRYSFPPVQERLQWPALGEVTVEEVESLARELVQHGNDLYQEIHGNEDVGAATTFPIQDQLSLDLRNAWDRLRQSLDLPIAPERFGDPKTVWMTPVLEQVGIGGFYFPWTGEANLRRGLPGIEQARMIAHEMAHQRGVARESEANFWAVLMTTRSRDLGAQYSGTLFAQNQMLSTLAKADRPLAEELASQRLPGVQRDLTDARNYWQSFEGVGTRVGHSVNHAYLRSNQVEGGIANYSMSVQLLLLYARLQGGTLLAHRLEAAPSRDAPP